MVPPRDSPKGPEGYCARFLAALMNFMMFVFLFLRSISSQLMKKHGDAQNDEFGLTPKEDCSRSSPESSFNESELLSSVVKRLGDLEEKVNTLEAKPSEMPYEKEELLNAAVYRVDALEAELIATKKALHEALMKQEELLAYVDRQEEAKYQKKKSCW